MELVKIRKEKGFTQQSLADRLKITRQMVAAIERGVANPSVKLAKSIAKILDMDWTIFFADTNIIPQKGGESNEQSMREHL